MPPNDKRTRVGDRVTIYTRGKKKIYCADFCLDGKHQRVSLETRNKKIAIQRAVKIDADLATGKYSTPPPPTKIDAAKDVYLAFLKSEGRARRTLVRYKGLLEVFDKFCAARRVAQISQITMLLFDEYRASCREIHKERTVLHESTVIKQFMKWCRLRKLISQNPIEDYRLEKPKFAVLGGPSMDQVNAILAASTEPRHTHFAVLAFTGMRSGELQRLQRIDIDLEGNWIHIVSRAGAETKTRESRQVPIHPRLRKILIAARPPVKQHWYFTAGPSKRYPNGGNWINPKRVNDDFLKILKELELPAGRKDGGFTTHSLRHFFKTYCINCGIPKPVVDVWQGHKIDMSVGAQYYKLSDEDSQKFMSRVPFPEE